MGGAAPQAMPLRIFQERQQSRCRRAPAGWGLPSRLPRCTALLRPASPPLRLRILYNHPMVREYGHTRERFEEYILDTARVWCGCLNRSPSRVSSSPLVELPQV